MSKHLVIVESPAKAKTINKILGAEFAVKASMGHVRDLPPKDFGIDIERNFKPRYVAIKGREKVLAELKAVAAKSDTIYLAPDPDREGEAIAWHLKTALKGAVPEDRFLRVSYNEITAPAIREAFSHPGPIDLRKVDSQQARRVLDRLVGYRVSPLLWRRIRGAASAGRVQSVALRLVCERENEIRNFKPEEYWLLGAKVAKQVDPKDPFEIRLARINGEKAEIKASEQAHAVKADLEGRALRVAAIVPREINKRAMPPYITSSLQQAASSVLGYAPAYTMKLAQRLYEGEDFGEGPIGLITYMRTDSFHIAGGALESCRRYIGSHFGAEYLPEKPNFYRSRGSAQEAHEAIRPTDVERTPDSLASVLEPEELRLYRLIWQRFVASQMVPARIAQRTVEIEAVPPPGKTSTYLFRATASEVVFPGYMKATGGEERKKDENGEEIDRLPPLEVGEGLDCLEWLEQQKFTQPPPRFSEAALVRALEENGVGRPSTYASILSTLVQRRYVTREKRTLSPTDMGMKVCEFLVTHLGELFDVKFTAGMEEALDEIEEGRVEWTRMLGDFYGRFQQWLEAAKGPPADPRLVQALLDAMDGVREWAPENKRGKRTYSDQKFVESVRKNLAEEKPITDRQLEALKSLAIHYREQLPDLPRVLDELGLAAEAEKSRAPVLPPSPETLRKLELLEKVEFKPARQVGKKTYDDRVFADSLRRQVQGGRALSENQVHYLDRLVMKYSSQMENFETLAAELGLHREGPHGMEDVGPLLDALKAVKEWKPPVKRGRRTWDDHAFFQSLSAQHAEHRHLSPRQVLSLKKLATRYRAQIQDFETLSERYGLASLIKTRKPAAPEASPE
ncbi:MAG: type I DNA topoisomerase [Kiritimatiellae bacterium]|nr:type I DNA topoisomerase [Kiritimatiellia bacterium]